MFRFNQHTFQDENDGEGNQSGGGQADPSPAAAPPANTGLTQAQVDAIVKDRVTREKNRVSQTLAGLGIEGGLEGLQQTYAEKQREAAEAAKAKGQYKGLYEAEQKRAQELQSKFEAIEEERRQATIRDSLSSVASDAIAPGQVAQLVQMELAQRGLQFTVRDGAALVTDAQGMPTTDGAGGYLTAEAAIGDFLGRNPHFRKATAGDGAGAQSKPGQVPPKTPQKLGGNPWGDLSKPENIAEQREAMMAAMRDGTLK